MDPVRPTAAIDIGGETLEYAAAGTGTPTVVLINGAGGPLAGWGRIWADLSRRTSTFAYNRPGIGRSAKPTRPQAGSHLVSSLVALLQRAQQSPPYVLVGHSLGGLIANLFARAHPDLVAGAVLIEATSPDDPERMAEHETRLQRLVRRALDTVSPTSPLSEVKQVMTTVAEVRQAPPFPAIPLIVVTGTKPMMQWATSPEALATRTAHQRQLVALSPLGRQIEATRSGHFPQLTEPDVVIGAIGQILDRLDPHG